MLAEYSRRTPVESDPVPHEVPLTVSEPVLVVTVDPVAWMPKSYLVDPFPLTPVIVTQPDPPACTLDDVRFTPALRVSKPPRPSIRMLPPVVFTFTAAPLICTPSNVPD
jgi:hypothetical protein